jgi:hypothetical protein
MNVLIDANRLDGISDTFEIAPGEQFTVSASGLEVGDTVTFSLVSISRFVPDPCICPPFNVTLPSVTDEVPLRYGADPITLTRDRPYVILDAPQGLKLRAQVNTLALPLTTQVVAYEKTKTPFPSEYMRGAAL